MWPFLFLFFCHFIMLSSAFWSTSEVDDTLNSFLMLYFKVMRKKEVARLWVVEGVEGVGGGLV